MTTAGIRAWANRPPDQHPLPYANMGDLRRYHRATANQWAKEEVAWQKAKPKRRKLKEVLKAS